MGNVELIGRNQKIGCRRTTRTGEMEYSYLKKDSSFKKCAKCDFVWKGKDMYLSDPALKIIGYQANFNSLELGTFLFSHSCGTTMSIPAKEFLDLYVGHIFKKRATGSEECPKYCFRKFELQPCAVKCECAYVRNVVFIIRNWPKVRQK